MKTGHRNLFLPLVAAAAVLLGGISSANAEELEFTVDETQTTLVLTYVELIELGCCP